MWSSSCPIPSFQASLFQPLGPPSFDVVTCLCSVFPFRNLPTSPFSGSLKPHSGPFLPSYPNSDLFSRWRSQFCQTSQACLPLYCPLSFSPLFSVWVQVSFFIKTNKLGSHSVTRADLEPSVILLLHTLTLGSSRLLCFQSVSLSSFLDLQRSLLSRAVFHSCAILVGGVLAQHQHGFDPQHQIKPGTVVLTCNPSTQGRNSPASATQRVQRKPGKHEVLFQNKYIIK